MHFEPNALYHIYNRSNETVFITRENYLFFLKKVRKLIAPVCNIFAYVLMPNHFHFLVQATVESCNDINEKHRQDTQVLSKNIGTLLSSYTLAFNNQENRRGSLFSHHTGAKMLNDTFESNSFRRQKMMKEDYATVCFLYIHQNPVMAGLATKLEEWEFSSFRDYAGFRNGTLIRKDLTFSFIRLDKASFYEQSKQILDEDMMKKLY